MMYSTITISLIVDLFCFLFSLSNFFTVSYSRVCRKGTVIKGRRISLRVAKQSTAMDTQDNVLGSLDEKLQIGKGSACRDMVKLVERLTSCNHQYFDSSKNHVLT